MNITEKENFLMVMDGKIPEWIPNYTDVVEGAGSSYLSWKPTGVPDMVIDNFGVEFHFTADGPVPANTVTRNFQIEEVTDWEKVMPNIDLDANDWEADAKRAVSKIDRNEKVINYIFGGMWEEMHYIMGFENALTSLAAEPEATSDFLNAIADFRIDAMRRFCKYLKPDIVMISEHITTHRGLLMSPTAYKTVIKPIHQRVYDAVRELGAIPQMHVDGYVEEVLEDYHDIGVRMLQPFQVFNDINKYKKLYNIVAVGGWDAFGPGNRPESTEEDMRASVRLAMDSYGPGGMYVFWRSGVTRKQTDRMQILDDEARKYGRAFYKK